MPATKEYVRAVRPAAPTPSGRTEAAAPAEGTAASVMTVGPANRPGPFS
ncbi:hypothetical protein [Streptomyces sp. NRRL S-31]|nr:hypothetical protein [Streptomyces sp. NRRL S-31]